MRLSIETLRLGEDLEGLQQKGVICIGVIIFAFASATNYTPGAAVCQIVQHGLVQALLCMWLEDKIQRVANADSSLMFAANCTYITWHLYSLLSIKPSSITSELLELCTGLITTICAVNRHSDIGQLRSRLQIWPRCKQTYRAWFISFYLGATSSDLLPKEQRRSLMEYGRKCPVGPSQHIMRWPTTVSPLRWKPISHSYSRIPAHQDILP